MQTLAPIIPRLFRNKSTLQAFATLFFGFVFILIACLFVFWIYTIYSSYQVGKGYITRHVILDINLARALESSELQEQFPMMRQRGFSVHLQDQPLANSIIITTQTADQVRQIIDANYPKFLLSVQLDDGKWLVLHSHVIEHPWFWFGMSASMIALFIALLSLILFVVNQLAMPTQQFIRAAERFGLDVQSPPMPIGGTDEVRDVIKAFNEMQNRIRRLLTDRTQMLAAISHDLRTPITRLQLRIERLPASADTEKMINDLKEMENMINSILIFARDYVRNEPTEKVDLNALLETICDNLIDAGHKITYHGLEERLPFFGRITSLKRAFSNLIENAIKYGDTAEVFLQCSDNMLQIKISDEGPGIPENEMENVFAPFYRINKARSPEKSGSGLGLAVARDIIRTHGGDITLINREPKGLTVTVTLKT